MKHSPRFLRMVEHAKAVINELDVAGTLAQLEAEPHTVFIDVREESEWAAGRCAGALQLGRGILERDIEARCPDINQPIVLYCGGGYRSALAARSLQQMGYQRVWSMAGGWKDWVAAGAPVAQD